jgi:hypothetical protein
VRGSHVLELHRHLLSLQTEDGAFWKALQARLEDDPYDSLSMGIAYQLIVEVFGSSATHALAEPMGTSLPADVRSWLRMYGARSFLSSPPGTKLGLLLDNLVRESKPAAKNTWSLPRLPPIAVRALPGESLATRSGRYWIQGRYIASRVCYHVVEEGRLAIERRRWRRMVRASG